MKIPPSANSTNAIGLEIWLIGTTAEIAAATQALADLGRLHPGGAATPLVGSDAGRNRKYLRVTVAHTAPRTKTRATHRPGGPTLPGVA